MKLISSCWIVDPSTFEDHVALLSSARALKFEQHCPLEVIILSGFNELQLDYVEELKALNVNLNDCTDITRELFLEYRHLMQDINDYEFLCFIRWIVISRFLVNEDYVHIDADLHMQINSSDFLKLFKGLTGTFGSPCLVAEHGGDWFQAYCHYFTMLINDKSGLLQLLGDTEISLIRTNIVSDQDLINSLEKNNRLPTLLSSFNLENWSVFINPLWPYITKPSSPVGFSQNGPIDLIGGKPVLFWHLQNDFVSFLGRYYLLVDLLGSLGDEDLVVKIPKLPIPYLQMDCSLANIIFRTLDGLYRHSRSGSSRDRHKTYDPLSRLSVTQRFIHSHKGREVFSERLWWENSVFLPLNDLT
ncbi:hypothetical protein IQ216_03155 [Cyanobium sp. LEGE 06143]|uniref:hypothetical protein n=1 Tax=Cyanobium sp. LEGE 06143 TaxID=945727 RepID=UPI00187E749D|nr:hypothetical protein [Cyanobium sp. LEGE 06143]MBE9172114.1 hypothetical protein [Cyanobium sp. LEGE 06143]